MPTNFPTSLDTTTNLPTTRADGTAMAGNHPTDHDNVNAAVVAIETKLGIGTGAPGTTGQVLTTTSAGASGWQSPSTATMYLSVKGTSGAKGDCRKLTTGAITAGTATFTSSSAPFVSTDVGKRIYIVGAGAAAVAGVGGVLGPIGQYDSTITGFTNTSTVTLGTNIATGATTATTTVSNATFYFGTDDSSAINATITAAAASAGTGVWIDAGMYAVNNITAIANVDIRSDAATLVHMGGGSNSHIISMVGTTSTATNLTANVAVNARTVVVSSNTGFVVGDFVLVQDTLYKVPAAPNAGRNQEINRIMAISGTTITLNNLTLGTYTTARTAQLVKLLPINNVLVDGLILENPVGQDVGGPIILTYCYNVALENLTCLRPSDDPGIYIVQSAVSMIFNCLIRDGQDQYHTGGGYGYGVILEESNHGVVISSCNTENVRESSMTYNCRYCIVTGCTDIGSVDSSWNTHGTGNEACGIVNCVSIGVGQGGNGHGFSIGGGRSDSFDVDCFIENCIVVNSGSIGILVQGGDSTHRTLRSTVSGNTIRNPCVVDSNQGIYILDADQTLVSNNMLSGQSSNMSNGIMVNESSGVQISNNVVSDMATSGIRIYGGTLGSAQCSVTGNTVVGTASPSIVDDGGGVANAALVIRNNICQQAITYTATTIRGGNIVNGVAEPTINPVSATAVAITTGGTVAVGNLQISRVSPAGAVTGVIIAAGTFDGQPLTVVNQAVAANSVTFAASGTSRVADGTSSVIAGLTSRTFIWNASTSLWYASK